MFVWCGYSMKFEYNSKESKINKEKHGIFSHALQKNVANASEFGLQRC